MNAQHATPLLRFDRVGRVFRNGAETVHALRKISLEVQRGEFVLLSGPSGSGKSTLLHLAALLDRPTDGTLWFAGSDAGRADERQRAQWRIARVGIVFQHYGLLPRRTVLDNVCFRFRYADVDRRTARDMAGAALEAVGLDGMESRLVGRLSGGEQQRVAIARAMASPPDLLVVDEPTGNLDRAASERIRGLLALLHRRGQSVLLASHDPAWTPLASRRWRLASGRGKEAA